MKRAVVIVLIILNTIAYLPRKLYAQTFQETKKEILTLMLEHQKEKEDLEKEIALLSQSNSDLERALADLKNLNARLETKAEELYLKSQGAEQIKAEYENLKSTVENLDKEISALKDKNEKEKQEKESLLLEISEKENMSEEIAALKKEKSELENSLSSVKNYNAQLETKAKDFYLKVQSLEQKERELQSLSRAVESLNKERLVLRRENEELQERLVLQESILQNEKAILYEKLGTAYTRAKLFDFAIDSYLKSLSFNPQNAKPHYNLGLLYKHSKNNIKKSVYHFKQYLRLNPEAKDRKEVEYLIKMLRAD